MAFGRKSKNDSGQSFGRHDPLAEVEYTGDLSADSEAELQALDQAYRDRAAQEQKRRKLATDSEFWFAVCFESREEKEAFLKAVGAKRNIHGDKYISGKAFAKLLNIEY